MNERKLFKWPKVVHVYYPDSSDPRRSVRPRKETYSTNWTLFTTGSDHFDIVFADYRDDGGISHPPAVINGGCDEH